MDTLATLRLRLRRFSATDAELLVELDSDPEVMRFLSGGAPTPRLVVVENVLPRFRRESAEPGLGYWPAFTRPEDEFVGWFSLCRREGGGAELGYRLKRSAWGRGLATEGSAALIRQAFLSGRIDRVTAVTYEENVASRRVLEKLGMRLVRSFRMSDADVADASYDTQSGVRFEGEDVEYALDASDWAPLSSTAPYVDVSTSE
jgi:RimJ/RimL family protein N-acetyltransferase